MNLRKLSELNSIGKRRLAIVLGTLILSLSAYATPSVHAQAMTSTNVSCDPPITGPMTGTGQTTTCTATVTSTSGSAPTGTVDFTASVSGGFSPASSCTLGSTSVANEASCSVNWMPALQPSYPVVATMTANYRGDMNNSASSGSTIVLLVIGNFGNCCNALATTTSVVCGATKLPDHKSTGCTATVSNATPLPSPFVLPPTGTVSWACSPSPCGSFTPPGSCTLSPTSSDPANSSSCTITFTAMAGKPTTVTITASYSGDTFHQPSSGTTTITSGT